MSNRHIAITASSLRSAKKRALTNSAARHDLPPEPPEPPENTLNNAPRDALHPLNTQAHTGPRSRSTSPSGEEHTGNIREQAALPATDNPPTSETSPATNISIYPMHRDRSTPGFMPRQSVPTEAYDNFMKILADDTRAL